MTVYTYRRSGRFGTVKHDTLAGALKWFSKKGITDYDIPKTAEPTFENSEPSPTTNKISGTVRNLSKGGITKLIIILLVVIYFLSKKFRKMIKL